MCLVDWHWKHHTVVGVGGSGVLGMMMGLLMALGNGKMEEVKRDVVGRGVEDEGHDEDEESMLGWNTLYPLPAGVT